jgi:hypothetical protein
MIQDEDCTMNKSIMIFGCKRKKKVSLGTWFSIIFKINDQAPLRRSGAPSGRSREMPRRGIAQPFFASLK